MATGTTDLSILPAPPDVIASLAQLRDALATAAGDNLHSLVLYGGLARGSYRPHRSDINLALVSRDDAPAYLAAIAPILRDAFRRIRVEPFLLTLADLPKAARFFPIKILDIRRRHVLLLGTDPFADLAVDPRDVARRIEQELRNLAMRLRRRFVASADDDRTLHAALNDAAVALRTNLLAAIDLVGDPPPADDSTAAVFDAAARRFHLDALPLSHLAASRNNALDTGPAPLALLSQIIPLTSRLADTVAALEVAP